MLTLILGNQLFASWLEEADTAAGSQSTHTYLMIESPSLATQYRFHQHKLVLVFAGMRKLCRALRQQGAQVDYHTLEAATQTYGDFFALLLGVLQAQGIRQLRLAQVPDRAFDAALRQHLQQAGVELVVVAAPDFLTSNAELRQQLSGRKPLMKTFYQWQRKRLGILMEQDGEPAGGRWSFDTENRKKLPRGYRAPPLPPAAHQEQSDEIVEEVKQLVSRLFPDHPGTAADFWLPTDHAGAQAWLVDFIHQRLADFGPYEDALAAGTDPAQDFLNHSVLSPLLNLGLLTPAQVVDAALHHAHHNQTPMASLEGFVRQIIGWREFVKGIDVVYGDRQATANFFGHHRLLLPCWYDGTTGLPPLDDAICKAQRRGYNHHIERLMVIGNAMLLAEVAPQSAYQWFMEMYVDSYDWVMGPNVFGMSQFSDGGIFATKPYICGSNYLLKMSDYAPGDWCATWDGLYWRFIHHHQAFFLANPRLSMMVRLLDNMADAKRTAHLHNAAQFIARTTRPASDLV